MNWYKVALDNQGRPAPVAPVAPTTSPVAPAAAAQNAQPTQPPANPATQQAAQPVATDPEMLKKQQVNQLITQLNQKFPGIMEVWRNPGSGKQAITKLLSALTNGIDAQSITFLKSRLQQLNNLSQTQTPSNPQV